MFGVLLVDAIRVLKLQCHMKYNTLTYYGITHLRRFYYYACDCHNVTQMIIMYVCMRFVQLHCDVFIDKIIGIGVTTYNSKNHLLQLILLTNAYL